MIARLSRGYALGGVLLLLVGCGTGAPSPMPSTDVQRVTLHVADMAERLDLA